MNPSFFIVGLPKCGTTSLYRALQAHPDIFMPEVKEPHFFGKDLTRDPDVFYVRESDYLALFQSATPNMTAGEASVNTIFSRSACEEIHSFNSCARIVIMLRNPVDMLHALHAQYVWTGVETETDFARALALEDRRRRGLDFPPGINLKEKVFYRTNLKRVPKHIQLYQEQFGLDGVHVILLDDMAANMGHVYRDVLQFLSVDDSFVPNFRVFNRSATVRSEGFRDVILRHRSRLSHIRRSLTERSTGLLRLAARMNRVEMAREPLASTMRRSLTAEFAPTVQRIGQLIGKDLSDWQ